MEKEREETGIDISITEGFFMVLTALMFDLAQLIIDIILLGFGFVVNWMISIMAYFTFYMWYKMKGINFTDWRKAAIFNGGALTEFLPLPLSGFLPAWTLSVIMMIMSVKIKKIVQSSLIIIVFLVPILAQATVETGSNQLRANISPRDPGPSEKVTITLEGNGLDIARSRIIWFLDDKTVEEGVGRNRLSFTVGEVGSSQKVEVSASKSGLIPARKTFLFYPAEVDLIWEADTYTPPFYKGHSLPSSESAVKIVALPNIIDRFGKRIDDKELIYDWSKDSRDLPSFSGVGKNILTVSSPKLFGESVITVTASAADGSVKAKKTISINVFNPTVIFYKNHSLGGVMYNAALSSNEQRGDGEISIKAEPYFISKGEGGLKYIWTVNGRPAIPNSNDFSLITVEPDKSGSVDIGLKINNPKNVLQTVSSNLRIDLTWKEPTNF